jgi:hypothetical protein
VLALAFYPPLFPRNVRSGRFDIELAAVVLATAGLMLALRGLTTWSLASSGWKRLWAVLSLVYLLVIVGVAWNLYPRQPSRVSRIKAAVDAVELESNTRQTLSDAQRTKIFRTKLQDRHASEQLRFILKTTLMWAGPVGAAYLLGLAVRWVYRGFRPNG